MAARACRLSVLRVATWLTDRVTNLLTRFLDCCRHSRPVLQLTHTRLIVFRRLCSAGHRHATCSAFAHHVQASGGTLVLRATPSSVLTQLFWAINVYMLRASS
jgi:hypothetical protein